MTAVQSTNPYHTILLESLMNPAGYLFNVWDVTIPEGVTLEEILIPVYWRQVARKMKFYDTIRAVAADRSFYVELLVEAVEPIKGAKLSVKYLFDPKAAQKGVAITSAAASDYEIRWAGFDKYRVKRLADNVVISKNHSTEAEARVALDEHLKSALA